MKMWLVSIILAVLVVGTGVFVAIAAPRPAPGTGIAEYISGLKRSPGTFVEPSINISSGADTLGEPDVTIDIIAVRPAFIPKEIRVKQGQVVKLRFTAKDNGLADMPGVDEAVGLSEFSGHGFQLLGPYDVWITGIRTDKVKEVTFKASEAGEFAFECVVFCHPAHYTMQGKLIVEPQ